MANTFLALDYGLKRIGVAVGNDLTQTAQGLVSLPANRGEPDWQAIARLQAEWHPSAWVLGAPLDPDGQETTFSQKIRKFGQLLENKTDLPVFYADERLSSNEAEKQLREGISTGKRFSRKKIAAKDLLAAELILKAWLQQA